MEQEQFTDVEWEQLIETSKSAARRNASDNVPWHKAFGIELLAAAARITQAKHERNAVSILST